MSTKGSYRTYSFTLFHKYNTIQQPAKYLTERIANMLRYTDVRKGVRVHDRLDPKRKGTLTGNLEPHGSSPVSKVEIEWDSGSMGWEYPTALALEEEPTPMSPDEQWILDVFDHALANEAVRATSATGASPSDYKYDRAEAVRATQADGYVEVKFHGRWHSMARETFGALDGDQNKSTVLIQSQQDGLWYKLWYYDKDVTR